MQDEVFKLQHLLDASMLKHQEEIEDLAAAAVKEKQIERKLEALSSEWAVQDLAFNEHKARGPVIIKPSAYAELVEKLEESQMNLSSMATNRYSKPFEGQVRAACAPVRVRCLTWRFTRAGWPALGGHWHSSFCLWQA